MKSMIVFAQLVAAAVAVPVSPPFDYKTARTVISEFENIGVDGYRFKFQTDDGKSVIEEAILKNKGLENEGIEVRGSYSYPGDDGLTYTVNFVANEFGYQATGDHLPK